MFLLAFVFIGNADNAAAQPKPKNNNQEFRGALYKEARNKKEEHVVLNYLPDRSVLAPNLRHISRHSTDVIVGNVLQTLSYLNDSGDEIDKFVTVLVQQVFKGTAVSGGRITIKRSGGTWLYGDGTIVTWAPLGEAPELNGKSYVFFLVKDNDSKHYVPSLGAQGVLELDFKTGVIIPTDLNRRNPLVMKYLNSPLQDFLDEVQSVVDEEISEY